MRPRRQILILASAVLVLGGMVFLVHERLLLVIGDFLIVQDDLQPVDLIHIPSGPDYRTDYAVYLYHQGYAQELFLTGGWCTAQHENHAELARQRAIEGGVPAQAVITDRSEVASTYDEALRLKAFITHSRARIQSVMIVSAAHHMRRAQWTYRKVLGDGIEIRMAPVPFQASPFKHRWWTDWDTAVMVIKEYMKMVYYKVRYP